MTDAAGHTEDESLMLGLFLDFLTRQALSGAEPPLTYTAAMAAEDDELLGGLPARGR